MTIELSVIQQINQVEEQLKQAMIDSDISILEKLLSNDLIFTNHLGMVIGKQADLDLHSSGNLSIKDIVLSEQKIKLFENLAVVTVSAAISACYFEKQSQTSFRFTRIWRRDEQLGWQLIAGHSCIIV